MSWIEWEDYKNLLNGLGPEIQENLVNEYYSSNCSEQEREILPLLIQAKIQSRILHPRNEVDDSKPFYMERLYFHENGGLFCLLKYENNKWKERIEKGLRLLESNGLGTDRAVGNGQFQSSFESFNLPEFKDSNYAVNLSLFCPVSQESLDPMLKGNAAWDILARGGWLGEPNNSLRKRSVYMFKEGSVLQMNNEIKKPLVLGSIQNLRPATQEVEHPVYRSGAAIFLPIQV